MRNRYAVCLVRVTQTSLNANSKYPFSTKVLSDDKGIVKQRVATANFMPLSFFATTQVDHLFLST